MASGNAFLDRLLEQAPQTASQPARGQNYNFPQRLFLKPDGEVVYLQGDPISRAYYQDKGYHLLSDAPGRNGDQSEVKQYLDQEYPRILEEQKEKANIINAIRRAVANDRNLNIDEEGWEQYSIEEMRDVFQQIKEETGRNIRVVKPRIGKPAAADRMMSGVETTDQTSMEEVQARRRRGGSE